MAIDSVIAQIDAEIARLNQVRSLLSSAGRTSTATHNGRAKKSAVKSTGKRKRRVLSADARRRIAEAQRKRWAAQKARAK